MLRPPPTSTLFPYTTLFRSLVAHEPAVALRIDEREELFERHHAAAGRKPIGDLPGLDARGHVAERTVDELVAANVVDVTQRGAAPPEVVGVEQEPAARVPGRDHHLAHPCQRVELLGLRVELDREPHAMLCRQLADLADALRRPPEVTAPLRGRACYCATAGRRGPPAP